LDEEYKSLHIFFSLDTSASRLGLRTSNPGILNMDETQPLLRSSSIERVIDDPQEEENVFNDEEFKSADCYDNPINWPNSYKWGVIALLAFMAFTVYVVFLLVRLPPSPANYLIFNPAHSTA
jgi:hypothetical protein